MESIFLFYQVVGKNKFNCIREENLRKMHLRITHLNIFKLKLILIQKGTVKKHVINRQNFVKKIRV